jgi:hypothetical protein
MSQVENKICSLRVAAEGCVEPCPGERCAFWEPGGAVIEGGCVVERLGLDLTQPDLAEYLLEVRQRVEQGRVAEELEEAHREFARRLGRDV